MPSEYARAQWKIVQERFDNLKEDMEKDLGSFACYMDILDLERELKQLKAELRG